MRKIYVVGKECAEHEEGLVWDIIGIFEKETDAVKACTKDDYFVGPMPLNEALPDERQEWKDAYFPNEKA